MLHSASMNTILLINRQLPRKLKECCVNIGHTFVNEIPNSWRSPIRYNKYGTTNLIYLHLVNEREDILKDMKNSCAWWDCISPNIVGKTDEYFFHPGYWQMCVEYIVDRGASSSYRAELKNELMLANMMNNIFPLISNIILPKMLTVLETSSMIYWIWIS